MKKIWVFILLINILGGMLIATMVVVERTCPYRPWEPLFGVQDSAEQLRLMFTGDAFLRANISIDFAERRLADLAQANNSTEVDTSLVAFEGALGNALHARDCGTRV